MTGYHTRWARPEEPADDPERLAIHETLAFGKALYGVRTTLGLSVAELALRASLTEDDIERIEEGGTEPTIPSASPPRRRPQRRRPPHRRPRPRLSLVRNPRRLTPPRPSSNACCPAPEPPFGAACGSRGMAANSVQKN
jgi:hypothetical protein